VPDRISANSETPDQNDPPNAPSEGSARSPKGAEPETVVRATGLVKRFPVTRTLFGRPLQTVRAVDGVDLKVQAGTTLGIVGESGSGKTTVGQLIARLQEPDEGTIEVEGADVTRARGRALKAVRERLQFIRPRPSDTRSPSRWWCTAGSRAGR
jgi:ABC-type oligopeptide transport system ATPase subunit